MTSYSAAEPSRPYVLRRADNSIGNDGDSWLTLAEQEVNELGNAWVGPRARLSKDKRALTSEDGLRQY